jgi:hypothetical protein
VTEALDLDPPLCEPACEATSPPASGRKQESLTGVGKPRRLVDVLRRYRGGSRNTAQATARLHVQAMQHQTASNASVMPDSSRLTPRSAPAPGRHFALRCVAQRVGCYRGGMDGVLVTVIKHAVG